MGLTIDGRGTAAQLVAGDCKSPERLAGDFQGQIPNDSNHKVQSSNLKVQSNDNVQDNRFQGTDSYLLFLLALLFSLPNLVIAIVLMMIISAILEVLRKWHWQPKKQKCREKNLIAFDLFQESAGLKGMDIDTVGSSHSSLLAIMSAGASRVMSEEELMKVVAKKMPSYYQENDCHQLIHDFYAKYGDSSKPFSRDVIRVQCLGGEVQAAWLGNTVIAVAGDCKSPQRRGLQSRAAGKVQILNVQSEDDDYPAPPPMPEKLPKLVELLISKTPEIYKPAVAHAIFPPLATHLWQNQLQIYR